MLRIPTWLIIDIRHKLERAVEDSRSFKNYIEQHPAKSMTVTASFCIVLLAVSLTIALRPSSEHKTAEAFQEWFYDLNTGKLFTANAGQSPPIDAPSGPLPDGKKAGVRAYAFKYQNEPNMVVGFLETTVKEKNGWFFRPKSDSWGKNRLIRRVNDKQWYPADSNEAQTMRKQFAMPDKDGKLPIYCRPENK